MSELIEGHAGSSPDYVPALDHWYTSAKEMWSIFSQTGIKLRAVDKESDLAADDILQDVIDEATLEVDKHLSFRYDTEHLKLNRLVRRFASILACYFISQRRGNPEQLKEAYVRTMQELADAKSGRLHLPGISPRAAFAPKLSNVVIDRRYERFPGRW